MNGQIKVLVVVLLLMGCKEEASERWQLVFQNDKNGETLFGSKSALCQALKEGKPVRLSWGQRLADGTSCIEFAEPHFITLVNGTDVVVQLPESLIQTSYTNSKESFLNTQTPSKWHALMATDGHYHQFHTELGTGKIVRIMYLRANMSWFVPLDQAEARITSDTYVLDEMEGIVLDSVITK